MQTERTCNRKGEERIPDCPFHGGKTLCTSQIRIFKALPQKEQEILVDSAVHARYEKGFAMIEEDSPVKDIIVIRRGRVKICRFDAAGEEYILDILHDGQAIWHDLFLQDPVYHYSAVCLTDVTVCRISRQKFMDIIKANPETALSLIRMLSTELKDAKDKVMLLSIRSPEIRLAGFLLDRDMTCVNGKIHMKLDDIAASIGLRPETVSRNISRLEKKGLVRRLGQGVLQVTDRPALLKLYRTEKIDKN